MIKKFVSFVSLLSISFVSSTNLNFYAWQSKNNYPEPNDFPELHEESVLKRPNTAIAFTGGGSRSYLASIGYLAGLNELGLIPKIRYISGISGGSWATLTFSYSQLKVDDKVLLGPIVQPKDITQQNLQKMDSSCVRGLTNVNFVGMGVDAIQNGIVKGMADAWCYSTQETYYAPVGIKQSTRFSWNEATVNDIKKRNPSLKSETFLLPTNKDRPYPLVGSAMIGPNSGAPYSFDTRNFSMIEFTPLYSGHMRTLDISYQYNHGIKHTKRVGGVVETFAFPKYGSSPLLGLRSKTTDTLSGPPPTELMDIRYAGCASSFAPGAVVNTFPANFSNSQGLHFDYYSPTSSIPSSDDTLFCDGGSYENILLISMLQRRVEKIVLFINSKTPIQPASKWNVMSDPPLSEQISSDLSSFFGVLPSDVSDAENRAFDNRKNQVFAESDWKPVALTLQESQAKGDGIIGNFKLTTVQNDWWGIPAGITSQIVIVYMGRLGNWEKELTTEMSELLIPSNPTDAADLSVTVDEGPYKGFPHYITAGGITNYERANVLADISGWTILKNEELFRSIFQ